MMLMVKGFLKNLYQGIGEKFSKYKKHLASSKEAYWKLHPLKRYFVSLLILMILVLFFELNPSLSENIEQPASDIIMRLCKNDPIKSNATDNITILSVDADVVASWGKPFVTPREKLLEMLDFAVTHRASIIIIDFDLSRPEYWRSPSKGDLSLKNYLFHLDGLPEDTSPAVILTHRFTENDKGDYLIDDGVMLSEASLHDQKGNVFWANALMPAKEGLVRDYVLGFFAKDSNLMTLSAPAMADRLMRLLHEGYDIGGAKRKLREILSQMNENTKTNVTNALTTFPILMHNIYAAGIEEKKFSRIAHLVREGRSISRDSFQGKVVLIGAMHPWTADRHETVIGYLYGVEIMANALSTLMNYGTDLKLNEFQRILWILAMVFLLSLTFFLRVPWLIMLVIGVMALLFYIPAEIAYHRGVLLEGGALFLGGEITEMAISGALIAYALLKWWKVRRNQEHGENYVGKAHQ